MASGSVVSQDNNILDKVIPEVTSNLAQLEANEIQAKESPIADTLKEMLVVLKEVQGTLAASRDDKLKEKEYKKEIVNLKAQILKHEEAKRTYFKIQTQISELNKIYEQD